MAQDFPDDVWIQIAEIQWSDRGTLHNMSLTSRRMHALVVPVLFRSLEFQVYRRARSEPVMVRLIRKHMRARVLFNYPELLRHTRLFIFREHKNTVDSIVENFAPHENPDPEYPLWRRGAESFLAVLHDAIFGLIFRMPGLQEIQIGNSAMTPLCYAAISSRPLLTSLSLEPRSLPNITQVTPALPHALRLRNLAYNFTNWTGNDRLVDPYLADILHHCILDLEKLTISSNLLLLVVKSHIQLHRMLSLRTLSFQFYQNSEESYSPAVAAFFQVLRVCPQLRHLSLTGQFPAFTIEPTRYLPPPSLPNLSTFYGTSRILQILSGGTKLVKIHICDDFYIEEQSLTQVILSPPMHLHKLSMRGVYFSTQTPHDFLTFIQSLSVFQNLESVDIIYKVQTSWKDRVSAQDLHSTIKDLLHQLPSLRFLDIHSSPSYMKGYDIGCPISKQGDPADRGHPSLESIWVDFLCSVWYWDSRTGWERSKAVIPQLIRG